MQKKNRKGVEIWVETEVDMDAHVFEPSSISEAEIATPGFVEKYVCDLSIAPPLPTSRPLWECHVLNGTSGNAAAHAILRMHHSLGDGTSLMSLMLACTRQTDNPEKLPSIPVSMGQSSAVAASQSFLQSFWKMLVLLVNTVWGIFYFLATVLWLKDSDTMIKGSAGVEQQPKLLVLTELNMEDMKFVKNTVGGVSSLLSLTHLLLYPWRRVDQRNQASIFVCGIVCKSIVLQELSMIGGIGTWVVVVGGRQSMMCYWV